MWHGAGDVSPDNGLACPEIRYLPKFSEVVLPLLLYFRVKIVTFKLHGSNFLSTFESCVFQPERKKNHLIFSKNFREALPPSLLPGLRLWTLLQLHWWRFEPPHSLESLLDTSKNWPKIRRIQCLREIRTNSWNFQSIGPKKLNLEPVKFCPGYSKICPKYACRSNERTALRIHRIF